MIRTLAMSFGILFSIAGCSRISDKVHAEVVDRGSSPIELLGADCGFRAKEFEIVVPAGIDSLRLTWEFLESDATAPRTICQLTPRIAKPMSERHATRVILAVSGDKGSVIKPIVNDELTVFLYCNGAHAFGRLKLPVGASVASSKDVYSVVSNRSDPPVILDEIRFAVPGNGGSSFALNSNSGRYELAYAPWRLRLYARWARE